MNKTTLLYIGIGVLLFWWFCRRPKTPLKQNGGITMDDDIILGGHGAIYPLDEPNLAGMEGEYAFSG